MAIKTFSTDEVLTASDTNTFLANAGLVYVTSASLSAGSTIGINNCFSSTMDHYRVLFTNVSPSTTVDIRWRLRSGGSGNATSNYWMQNISASASTISAFEEVSQTSFRFNYAQGGSNAFAWADLYFPFSAQNTTVNWTAMSYAGNIVNRSFLGFFNTSTSFDGLEIVVASGTVTGNITVYGYRKA